MVPEKSKEHVRWIRIESVTSVVSMWHSAFDRPSLVMPRLRYRQVRPSILAL